MQLFLFRETNRLRAAKALLLLVSLIIAIALFEILFRVLKIEYNINPNWKYHRVLGWSQVPSARYVYQVEGKKILVEFNSKGFRDVEHSLQKPPGTRRIVLIGDSFSEAIQVNLEETFYRKLEKRLNQEEKERWEVINLGVGDFGTTQEWIALTQFGLAYSPDLVISQIFPLNDICNNTIELCGQCLSPNDRYRPYFVESGEELVLTSAQPFRNFLRHHLAAYGIMERNILKLMKQPKPASPEDLCAQGLLHPLLYTYVSDQDQIESIAKGWRRTELILGKMIFWCRRNNIPFMAVVVPFEYCLDTVKWESLATRCPSPRIIRDYPEQRLGRLFDRLNVPALMLEDIFERQLDFVLPFIDGHFSRGAHQSTAESIYWKLVKMGLVQ